MRDTLVDRIKRGIFGDPDCLEDELVDNILTEVWNSSEFQEQAEDYCREQGWREPA